jgi:trigger factor
VAELADAPGLGPGGAQVPWRFESSRPHLDGSSPGWGDGWHNARGVQTSVEELPENRVRLEVEVPEADVKHALEHAASDLASSVRIPGFRKGKVPVQLVMARVGREALWAEALRSHLDAWFWSAATASGIQPVAAPEVDLDELPTDGGPFRFTATVAVMPKPEVADWHGLEVPAGEPEVPDELIERELAAVRASVAELVPAGKRPVREGDTVVVDLVGDEAGTQRDYVTEVGAGPLVDEIDEALVGMSAGDTKAVSVPLDDERNAEVEVTVKDVKEKALPELDDELARAASEFDTLADLRADIEARLREVIAAELEAQFREDTIDALAEASLVELPDAVVERRAAELWAGLSRSLAARGISAETYVTMTGQSEEQLVAHLKEQAERAVKRELVLAAVADKLAVVVSDEELEAFVREGAEAAGDDATETLATMRANGTLERLRSDLRLKKALDEVAAGVKRIPVDLARAREKLWTPEKEKAAPGMKIWTPGSEEA